MVRAGKSHRNLINEYLCHSYLLQTVQSRDTYKDFPLLPLVKKGQIERYCKTYEQMFGNSKPRIALDFILLTLLSLKTLSSEFAVRGFQKTVQSSAIIVSTFATVPHNTRKTTKQKTQTKTERRKRVINEIQPSTGNDPIKLQ